MMMKKSVRKYRMFKEMNGRFVLLIVRYVTDFVSKFLAFLGSDVNSEVIASQLDRCCRSLGQFRSFIVVSKFRRFIAVVSLPVNRYFEKCCLMDERFRIF